MAIRQPIELTESERFEVKFTSGRVNLLAFLLVAVANIVFLVLGKSYLVPFFAAVPYYAVAYGYMPGYLSVTGGWMVAMAFLAVGIICWVRAKDDWRWLLGGFALITFDTIAMFWLISQSLAISFWPDIIFHAWMMYYLSTGVRYGRKLEHKYGARLSVETEDEE